MILLLLASRYRAPALATALMLLGSGSAQNARGKCQEQGQGQQQEQVSEPQQTASQPNPLVVAAAEAAARPKPNKVWTNDEVVALRSPTDAYIAEKEAQQAADAASAAERATLEKEIKQAGLTLDLPVTAADTEALIKDRDERLKDFQDHVASLNQLLPDAQPVQKENIRRQIDALTASIQKARLEVKVLRSHLADLDKATPAAPAPPASSSAAPKTPQN